MQRLAVKTLLADQKLLNQAPPSLMLLHPISNLRFPSGPLERSLLSRMVRYETKKWLRRRQRSLCPRASRMLHLQTSHPRAGTRQS